MNEYRGPTPSLESLLEDVVTNSNFRTVTQKAGIANTDTVEISILLENDQIIQCCLVGSSNTPDSLSSASNLGTLKELTEALKLFLDKDYEQNNKFLNALGEHMNVNGKKDGKPFQFSMEVKDDATKNEDLRAVPLRLCGPPFRVC